MNEFDEDEYAYDEFDDEGFEKFDAEAEELWAAHHGKDGCREQFVSIVLLLTLALLCAATLRMCYG